MPNFDIIKRSKHDNSFKTAKIKGLFDIQKEEASEHFVGSIDLPDNWQIGVIVGPSGSGKTTIAKELFGDSYYYEEKFSSASVINDLNDTAEEISKVFNSVGFSSPPSWLKPYEVLSNGEKMRVQLAQTLLSDAQLTVFDEFTSVVDRQVAQVGSAAVQKAIRRTDKQFIAVTCHYDVLDWLEPDWVFDTKQMQQVKKNSQDLNYSLIYTKSKDIGTCFNWQSAKSI